MAMHGDAASRAWDESRPTPGPWAPGDRTAYVVGAVGCGKTHYARGLVQRIGGTLLTATRGWSEPGYARSRIEVACRSGPPLLVLDDADHLQTGPAEDLLESVVADPPARRLVVVSRRLPTFATSSASVIRAQELSLGLLEIASIGRDHRDAPLDLETASLIRHETSGWAGLAYRLVSAASTTPDEFAAACRDHRLSDFAAAWLETAIATLDAPVRENLERAAVFPTLAFSQISRVIGAASAAKVVAALDDGAVMSTRRTSGQTALPPLLRAHLLDRLSPDERARTAVTAATILVADGDPAGAADALAAGRAWPELAALLERAPDSREGSGRWQRFVPQVVARDWPPIAIALERARHDDEASVVVTSVSPDAAPAGRLPADPLRAAIELAGQGDEVGAARALHRLLQSDPPPRAALLARLAIVLIRAPVVADDATVADLCRIESFARDHALDGIARVVRGAISASAPFDRHAVRTAVEHLEVRGDRPGALLVRSLDLLVRLRRGETSPSAASAVAELADSLGAVEVGVWARVGAAAAAASQGLPASRGLVEAARSAATEAGLRAAHIVLDGMDALRAPSPESERRLTEVRRRALEAGLPRIPPAVIAHADAPSVAPRTARVEIRCFGGFRLSVGGVEYDLKAVRPQARAVLRILALGAGAPLHRDVLASLVWGNLTQASALHALHVSISSLRHQLPAGDNGDALVQRVGEAYRIGLDARDGCDLTLFDKLLTEAASAKAQGDAVAARDGLTDALDLYSGDVLPEDGDAEWVVGARDRYRLRAAEASNSLAHLHAHLGEVDEAVSAARRAVELDPWADASWRTLMAMHRRAGDVIASRRAQEEYLRMRAELGVE